MRKSWCSTERAARMALVLIGMLTASSAFAADNYRPWPGEFMRMGAGARAQGMGNAYGAVPGDIYSSYFNPAGLALMNDKQLAISMHEMSFDRRFMHLAYGSPIGPDADIAFTWIQAGTEDIVGRDLNGNPTGSLEDKRTALGISFSKRAGKYLSFGLNTKLLLWKLGEDDAKTYGFDAGLLLQPVKRLTLSFVLRDINSRFVWKSEYWKTTLSGVEGQPIEKTDDFPVYWTAGAAYRLFSEKGLVAVTVESIEDNPLAINAGASYTVSDRLTLRTGMYRYTKDAEIDTGSPTFGFTLVVTPTMSFDYAYLPDDMESDTLHTFAFLLTYGDQR